MPRRSRTAGSSAGTDTVRRPARQRYTASAPVPIAAPVAEAVAESVAGTAAGHRAVPLPAAGRGTAGAPALDRLIHERLRLGIVSALAVNETLSFNDLKTLLDATDGNLSVHARKLEDAGYVACTKTFQGRMPHTDYRLTPIGRSALERYLQYMEDLIRLTRAE